MEHISELVRKVVTIIKNGEIPDTVFATVAAPCPKCGGEVQENYRKFQCQKCDFSHLEGGLRARMVARRSGRADQEARRSAR